MHSFIIQVKMPDEKDYEESRYYEGGYFEDFVGTRADYVRKIPDLSSVTDGEAFVLDEDNLVDYKDELFPLKELVNRLSPDEAGKVVFGSKFDYHH